MRKLIETIDTINEDELPGVDVMKVSKHITGVIQKATNTDLHAKPFARDHEYVVRNVAEILAYVIDNFDDAGFSGEQIHQELSSYRASNR